jgi:hypothetical protein
MKGYVIMLPARVSFNQHPHRKAVVTSKCLSNLLRSPLIYCFRRFVLIDANVVRINIIYSCWRWVSLEGMKPRYWFPSRVLCCCGLFSVRSYDGGCKWIKKFARASSVQQQTSPKRICADPYPCLLNSMPSQTECTRSTASARTESPCRNMCLSG